MVFVGLIMQIMVNFRDSLKKTVVLISGEVFNHLFRAAYDTTVQFALKSYAEVEMLIM